MSLPRGFFKEAIALKGPAEAKKGVKWATGKQFTKKGFATDI